MSQTACIKISLVITFEMSTTIIDPTYYSIIIKAKEPRQVKVWLLSLALPTMKIFKWTKLLSFTILLLKKYQSVAIAWFPWVLGFCNNYSIRINKFLSPVGNMGHIFCNFYLAKNHKIANSSTTTKAREKINTYLESLEFFDICFTKFWNNRLLLNWISHWFLLSTKL